VEALFVASLSGTAALWCLFLSLRAFKTGKIRNFFGRGNHTVYGNQDPVAFLGAVIGWLIVGGLGVVMAIATGADVPILLWAVVPAYLGPGVAFYLLIRNKPQTIGLTPEVLVERVVNGGPDDTKIADAFLKKGSVRRLISVAAEAERQPDALHSIDVIERDERRKITIRVTPALAALAPPLVWLAARFSPRDPVAAWLVAAGGVLLAAIAAALAWAHVRTIAQLSALIRDRLSRVG
jgi:hypothetical protein